MPTRMLRDWTDSEAVSALSAEAERFFARLLMKADDFGLMTANPRVLRGTMFPLLVDKVREVDVSHWIAECEQHGLIRLYTVAANAVGATGDGKPANAPTTPQDSPRAANAGSKVQDVKSVSPHHPQDSSGKTFLAILNFGQRIRAPKTGESQRDVSRPKCHPPPWIVSEYPWIVDFAPSPNVAANRGESRPEAIAIAEAQARARAGRPRPKKTEVPSDAELLANLRNGKELDRERNGRTAIGPGAR